jgi:hypothetical protein
VAIGFTGLRSKGSLLIPGKPLNPVSLISGLAHATGDGFYTLADTAAKANHADFLGLCRVTLGAT